MLPFQTLAYQVEQISDRETRHRARSLLACYIGYGELQREDPAFAERILVLQRALKDLGLTFPAEQAPLQCEGAATLADA